MYYVYVLFSKDLNRKYIGVTEDLRHRIYQHQHKGSVFTSRANDWKLVYYEAFVSKKDAVAEERFLKSGQGRERLAFLLGNTLKDYIK